MAPRTEADMWADHKNEKALPVSKVDLTGKTIIITGANVGLGFEAAKHFAMMNPKKMILAVRDEAKGLAAAKEIGYAAAESVTTFADRVGRELERLDILLLNAGLAAFEYRLTEDGYESMLQVNDLSNLLLGIRLAPLLLKTAKENGTVSRLVNVSSEAFYFTEIDSLIAESKDNIYKAMSSKDYCVPPAWFGRYPQSKLIELFYTRSLQAHVGKDAPLVVTCLNPGFCYSSLRRDVTGPMKDKFEAQEKEYAYTTEEGSRQLVFGAVGGDPDELKGEYFSMCKVREVSDYALSEEGFKAERRFWDDGIEILEGADAKFKTALQSIAKV
ncbi:short-chain dehydrogenase [Cylindrobasidium torrendii FP15055 ss-10]|uniref:Short-chain dehydrogenase n=1 Tax=Cylindrobasidium torrendii FP15055 ss-10 TaxID=1314674 RepID=A0A0D7B5K2_9AGAR|nr:short-chain dehydrogenase [Cylindrobasidium torrendii FP15055 ss-10]